LDGTGTPANFIEVILLNDSSRVQTNIPASVTISGNIVRYNLVNVPAGSYTFRVVSTMPGQSPMFELYENTRYYLPSNNNYNSGSQGSNSTSTSGTVVKDTTIGKSCRNFGTVVSSRFSATGSLVKGDTEDWYKFTLDKPGDLDDSVKIEFQHSQGNVNMYLYSSNGTSYIRGSGSTTHSETINFSGLSAGTYYVKVFGYNGATNPSYKLTMEVKDNDKWQVDVSATKTTAVERLPDVEQQYGEFTFERTSTAENNEALNVKFDMIRDSANLNATTNKAAMPSNYTTSGDYHLEYFDESANAWRSLNLSYGQ
jgi:hypothetical protein